MCKGPVVVRIEAGARVKEGWCDWGHGRDGHNEGNGWHVSGYNSWVGRDMGKQQTRFLISGTVGLG